MQMLGKYCVWTCLQPKHRNRQRLVKAKWGTRLQPEHIKERHLESDEEEDDMESLLSNGRIPYDSFVVFVFRC
ncbi:MAG: hypothetical protein EZS28_055505 [Streblomastix strix]|uniref:Uncharacterized protein n=1 Tax=Streblomastix strix TaxID=222440 RepID=A0A5J4Q1H4_9EUKA|nr:MAG: hypothetical protein EZS28_055505 [Streblomastix strix]